MRIGKKIRVIEVQPLWIPVPERREQPESEPRPGPEKEPEYQPVHIEPEKEPAGV